ncbi:MAG: hypothetical protein JWQ71_20, partial [Pedosphaera sp.]|nr:hypothetical protein [Pedosphaera sp.]
MNRVTEILTGGVIAPRPNTAPLAEGWNVLSGIDPGGIKPIPKITIQKLFEAQAALRPGAVALIFEGQSITYGDLNSRSNHLAARLRELGVGPEVLVGICVERSFEMLVGLLGILKAGGAYVPMDPSYPSERLEFLLRDAEPMVLLTQEKLLPSLPRHPAQVLCLDALPPGAGAENLQPLNSPDNAAYVIYTSGSTGQPKGVVVTHHNVIRLFAATDQWYGFSERDVWTLFHSFAFDFSVWEIFGALLHGGRLVVVPHPVSRSPDAFYELLAQERVTVLNQTPSAFRQLMQAEESFAGEKNLALRLVIFGGETLDLQSLKPWFERHGDTHPQLVNMYGITETTVHVTYRPLAADDVNQPSVIGLPIPDLQLHILDQQLNPVAIGEAGEIFVGGAGLARSYLKRPELTEQRFVGNPFSKEAGARLYRSGDIARRLPNNDIEYLGRADLQVKIRGHRVELGEIEAVLNQHPAIRESVVLLRQESGLPRLVGYLISC